jgi:hypothetical protein
VAEEQPPNECILGSEGFCELHAFQELEAEFTFPASDPENTTWAITSGTLPNGLSLNADAGIISGIPTEAGQFIFTIEGDNGNFSDTYFVTLTVEAAAF